MENYIAIDIGASSGRLILATLNKGKLELREIHRFKNYYIQEHQHSCWEIERLLDEILKGLHIAKCEFNIEECYLGIDTWAVDYCLLDEHNQLLNNPIAYRDERTKNTPNELSQKIPLATIYEKTGIQIQEFNTLFQLYTEKAERLDKVAKIALIPDYIGYRLTGNLVTEKTNASTMQLLNVETDFWDVELLDVLGLRAEQFAPLVDAGSKLGEIRHEYFSEYSLPQTSVITVATHDTASAIVGTPATQKNWAYISSGTWSLLGMELTQPLITEKTWQQNYTNEWGAYHTTRFLKNIMGMWLIQEVARMQDYQYSYAELTELAMKERPFQQFVDVNDPRFLYPENMITELQAYCKETNQTIPITPGELARCIYDNLALCYSLELEKLATLTNQDLKTLGLYIVGGGANNQLVNQLTADLAQIAVHTGPTEATALGNILVQMITMNTFTSLAAARQCVADSFPFQTYIPQKIDKHYLADYKRFLTKGEYSL